MKHSYIDEYSNIKSFLSAADARIKVAVSLTLVILITIAGSGAYPFLFVYAAAVLAMILLSRIPLTAVIKKYLVIVPFLFLTAVSFLFMECPDKYKIFSCVLLKSSLCVLTMILLTSTTAFSDLLKAFERLGCPQLIVMIVSFMYRYIFVIQDEFEAMLRAKQARSAAIPCLFHIKVLSNMVGVLFIRSYERSEAVYLAMRSRGFDVGLRGLDGKSNRD